MYAPHYAYLGRTLTTPLADTFFILALRIYPLKIQAHGRIASVSYRTSYTNVLREREASYIRTFEEETGYLVVRKACNKHSTLPPGGCVDIKHATLVTTIKCSHPA